MEKQPWISKEWDWNSYYPWKSCISCDDSTVGLGDITTLP